MKNALVLLSLFLVACASTQLTGYTDPAYQGHKYQRVVVRAYQTPYPMSNHIENALVSRLREAGVTAFDGDEVFPPTREYDTTEVRERIRQFGLDGGLVIYIGGLGYSDDVIGFQTYGSAHSFGNSAYGNATTVPLRSISRSDGARVVLTDFAAEETVWVGDAQTSGQGLVNTTGSALSSSLAGKIVSSLKEAGHI